MSRKNQMMVAEGISKKNILPRFGTNNSPNLKLEQDMRKFMYDRKPMPEKSLTEDAPSGSGGSTLAAANGNNVTGDGAVGSEAATAADASGVTEPVVRAVGEEAMNLAARSAVGEDVIQAFVNDITEALYGTETHYDRGSAGRDYAADIIGQARRQGKKDLTGALAKLDKETGRYIASAAEAEKKDDKEGKEYGINTALHYGNARQHLIKNLQYDDK